MTKVYEGEMADFMLLNGRLYKQRHMSQEAVFYDWLVDAHDIPRALEIHLAPDDALMQTSTPLTSISHVEIDCFVRIWLTQSRTGSPQGMEAFGDIGFFEDAKGRLAIVVGVETWLSDARRDRLMRQVALAN